MGEMWGTGEACSVAVRADRQRLQQRNESGRQAQASASHTQTSAAQRPAQEQSLKTMAGSVNHQTQTLNTGPGSEVTD
ncbi:hypothetical protein AOLI_G00183730 [Acnodon oligacanthus]